MNLKIISRQISRFTSLSHTTSGAMERLSPSPEELQQGEQDLASFASLVGAATERDVQATNDKQAAMGNQKQHTSNKVEAMAEDARKKHGSMDSNMLIPSPEKVPVHLQNAQVSMADMQESAHSQRKSWEEKVYRDCHGAETPNGLIEDLHLHDKQGDELAGVAIMGKTQMFAPPLQGGHAPRQVPLHVPSSETFVGGNPAGPKAAVAVPLETIEANAALAKRAAALDHEQAVAVAKEVSKLGVEPRVASGADPLDPVDTVHDAYAILTGANAGTSSQKPLQHMTAAALAPTVSSVISSVPSLPEETAAATTRMVQAKLETVGKGVRDMLRSEPPTQHEEAKQQLQQQAKANQLQSGEVMTPEKLRQIGGDVGSVDWPYAFNKNQTSNPDTGNVTQGSGLDGQQQQMHQGAEGQKHQQEQAGGRKQGDQLSETTTHNQQLGIGGGYPAGRGGSVQEEAQHATHMSGRKEDTAFKNLKGRIIEEGEPPVTSTGGAFFPPSETIKGAAQEPAGATQEEKDYPENVTSAVRTQGAEIAAGNEKQLKDMGQWGRQGDNLPKNVRDLSGEGRGPKQQTVPPGKYGGADRKKGGMERQQPEAIPTIDLDSNEGKGAAYRGPGARTK